MERDIQIGSILRGTLNEEDGILGLVIDVCPYGFVTLQIVGDTKTRRVYKGNLAECWEVIG